MKKSQWYKTGEIIAVGEEVLAGDTVNTNAAFISQELSKVGVFVRYSSVVGDDEKDIQFALQQAIERSEVIVFSGGLGPTKDDLTKEAVAHFFHSPFFEDAQSLVNIQEIFMKRNLPFTENNMKQAMIPKNGQALFNKNGTAPGIYIEDKEHELCPQIFLLPGPPRELQPMFYDEVIPRLRLKQKHQIYSKTLKLIGIGESLAASQIDDLLVYEDHCIVATYAKTGEVHIKITVIDETIESCQRQVQLIESKINQILGPYIYSNEDFDLPEVIIKEMIRQNKKLVTAESCTGGMLSSELIQVSGASHVFMEGFITYSNDSKSRYLGVDPQLILEKGAVSEEVAYAMVQGLKDTCPEADYAISITGIAGPEGGSALKPVGLVYIGLLTDNGIEIFENQFHGNRMKIREASVKFALTQLYKKLYLK
ncbi:MAG: competence/damage-inducible protein A [Vallitaleaceae bacterium]|nr:competence/damage-inducible protein A [Vallitaleaceae bacterium]